MSEKAIKPCPFCGSTDIGLYDYPFRSRRLVRGCFAYCTACGARGGDYYTIDEARDAWNERKGTNEHE